MGVPLRLAILLLSTCLHAQDSNYWLGQKPPGPVPELFAPGLVNTGLPTRDIAWMPDGSEMYFTQMLPGFHRAAVFVVRRTERSWSQPEVASFSRDHRWRTLEPCISADGKRLFFVTDRPADSRGDRPVPFAIWMADRQGAGWGEPKRLAEPVNGEGEAFFPSVTRDGTLYFLRERGRERTLFRAPAIAGGYPRAEKLPGPLNQAPVQANPFVDPDERLLIIPMAGRADSLGGADYYVSFRKPDGSWTEPENLGAPVNSGDGQEYSAALSPDGKVLFFMSARPGPGLSGMPQDWRTWQAFRTEPARGNPAIWWVDAGFLQEMRRKALAR